jgi:hypothetical protein
MPLLTRLWVIKDMRTRPTHTGIPQQSRRLERLGRQSTRAFGWQVTNVSRG